MSEFTLDLLNWSSKISGKNPFKFFLGGDQDEIESVRAKNGSAFLPRFLWAGALLAGSAADPIASQPPGPSDLRTEFVCKCLRLFEKYTSCKPSSAKRNTFYQFAETFYGMVSGNEDVDLHEPIRRAVKLRRGRKEYREKIKQAGPPSWDEVESVSGVKIDEACTTEAGSELMYMIRSQKK